MPIFERGPRETGELSISPEGRWAVIRQPDGATALWDVENAALSRTLTPWKYEIQAVAMNAEGRILGTKKVNRSSYVVDLATGETICGLSEETRLNHSAAFNAGGTRIIGSSMGYGDEPLGVWDTTTGASLLSEGDYPGVVALSVCGRYGVGSRSPNSIRVWDLETKKEPRDLRGHEKTVTSLAITARGEWLASGSVDQTLRLWHRLRWDDVEVFAGHEAAVTSVALTPGGRLILSASRDCTLRLWLRDQAAPLAVFEAPEPLVQCGISPDGHSLIASDLSKQIYFLRWQAN